MRRAVIVLLAGLVGLVSATGRVTATPVSTATSTPTPSATPTSELIPGELQFNPATEYVVASAVAGLASADFNGDGLPDLAVASTLARQVTILLGDGQGGFSQIVTSSKLGNTPAAIAVADLNGDGNVDVAVVEPNADNIEILLGKGDGSLGLPTAFRAGNFPVSIVTGDFDGQPGIDLAVANKLDNTVSFLFNRGSQPLSFSAPANFFSQTPIQLVVADFNGDGNLDALALDQSSIVSAYDVTPLLGNGTGGFQAQSTTSVGLNVKDLATGDFNGDGLPDLVATNSLPSASSLTLRLSNGDGTFSLAQQPQVNCAALGSTTCLVGPLAAADFDGDGNEDLVIAQPATGGALLFFLGDGNGNLTPFGRALKTQHGAAAMILDDFNLDGRIDIALGSGSSVQVFLNRTEMVTPIPIPTSTPTPTPTGNLTPAGTGTPVTPVGTPRAVNGSQCGTGSDCQSGICAQNRCCNQACDGVVMRCDLNPPGVCLTNFTPTATPTQAAVDVHSGGGCSTGETGGPSAGRWATLMLPAALWLGRRRVAARIADRVDRKIH